MVSKRCPASGYSKTFPKFHIIVMTPTTSASPARTSDRTAAAPRPAADFSDLELLLVSPELRPESGVAAADRLMSTSVSVV